MRQVVPWLQKFVQSLDKKHKIGAPAAVLLAFALIVIIGIANRTDYTQTTRSDHQPHVQTQANKDTTDTHAAEAQTLAAETSEPAHDDTTDQSTANTPVSTPKQTSPATNSPPALSPTAPPATSPAPTTPTTSNATFSLELNESAGYKDQTTGHLVTPFTITRDPGHTASLTATAYPSYGSLHTHCTATMAGDTGKLEIWFDTPLPDGFYVCTLSVSDGTTTRTADKPIDAYGNHL